MVAFKNRYMVMEVLLDPAKDLSKDDPITISQTNIVKAIKDSILVNFGECGLAASLGSLQVKYVNPITKLCIIRTSREEYQKVWSAMTMVRTIGNCPVIFHLLDLSVVKEARRSRESKYQGYTNKEVSEHAKVQP
ncbi:probable ribonuclease P/MRP protein subunit POP5 isoform X3 [Macadamia integrifolia]|uniref:probable ribonuclease P/MRP protein subunit POP5 isoform X3 n=1 Tax=Macadamia integrifolia TaxID=60698 RepID=UPI001C5332FC|nr:probable ribonuclease P/MRP protein subunit POP5 isoform X3 [Macadamia integrifolia]